MSTSILLPRWINQFVQRPQYSLHWFELRRNSTSTGTPSSLATIREWGRRNMNREIIPLGSRADYVRCLFLWVQRSLPRSVIRRNSKPALSRISALSQTPSNEPKPSSLHTLPPHARPFLNPPCSAPSTASSPASTPTPPPNPPATPTAPSASKSSATKTPTSPSSPGTTSSSASTAAPSTAPTRTPSPSRYGTAPARRWRWRSGAQRGSACGRSRSRCRRRRLRWVWLCSGRRFLRRRTCGISWMWYRILRPMWAGFWPMATT